MEINSKVIKTILEGAKVVKMFDKVEINLDDLSVVVSDFEEDHSLAAVYIWQVDEDRAYCEDLTQPFPLGDDVDNITSASDFEAWINSYHEKAQ